MDRFHQVPPWIVSLVLFALSAALWLSGLCLQADQAAVSWAVERSRVEPWASFWKGTTALGAWPGSAAVALAVAAVAVWLSIRRIVPIPRREALAWGALTAAGELANTLLKRAFGRDRPPAGFRLVEATSFSFPSGHSFFAGAAFGVLAYLAWTAARPRSRSLAVGLVALCGLAALLIASSRVALGVHYPTDVLGGLALGTAWADLSWRITRASKRRSGSKAPP